MEQGKTGKIKMQNNFEVDDDIRFEVTLRNALNEAKKLIQDKPTCIKTKQIYFAAPWFDERSKEIYSVCEEIQKICNDISPYKVFFPKRQVNNKPSDAFVKNVKNIILSDLVIALVSKKDCGTSWEIGMAYGLNKPVILLGYDESTFLSHTNVMLAFTGKCATIKELPKILCDLDYLEVKIKDEWDGIE